MLAICDSNLCEHFQVSEFPLDYTECNSTDTATKCQEQLQMRMKCKCEIPFELTQDFEVSNQFLIVLQPFYADRFYCTVAIVVYREMFSCTTA